MAGQTVAQTLTQHAGLDLSRQQLIDPAQGQKHLRPRRCQLAVAQHRELGIVHAAQIKGLRQAGQHPVAPAVALMPDPDQMGKSNPARCDVLPVAQLIRIRIATIVAINLEPVRHGRYNQVP